MIILDTNVLSETLRPVPDPLVVNWLVALPHRLRRITVITAGELLQGVFALPDGRRRAELHEGVEGVLETFQGKVLDVDARAAPYFGDIGTTRAKAGRPIGPMDAWIAAVCRCHDAPLATRNVSDFDGTGIAVINPWASA